MLKGAAQLFFPQLTLSSSCGCVRAQHRSSSDPYGEREGGRERERESWLSVAGGGPPPPPPPPQSSPVVEM